jgi:hypothetical protein
MIAWAVPRIAASIVVVRAVYYLLPFDRSFTGVAVTLLVAGLVVFVGLVAFQVRAIIVSPFPGLRAIEALATRTPTTRSGPFYPSFGDGVPGCACWGRDRRRAWRCRDGKAGD